MVAGVFRFEHIQNPFSNNSNRIRRYTECGYCLEIYEWRLVMEPVEHGNKRLVLVCLFY